MENGRILVTGATGILGPFLIEALCERGARIVALVRDHLRGSRFHGLADKVDIVWGDINDYDLVARAVAEYQIEGAFHLAAQSQVTIARTGPFQTLRTNIDGTLNLLEACRLFAPELRFVVVASSDKAYGEPLHDAYDESHPLRAVYPYDVSKACADMIVNSYHRSFGLPVSVTRCGNFFGPGDLNPDRLIPHVVTSLLAGRSPVIRSDGTLERDYFYVKDAAHAYLTLAERMLAGREGATGAAFNFSYNRAYSVLEIVDMLRTLMGREDIAPVIENRATLEIQRQCLDSSLARQVLGWTPTYSFEDGLKETVEWYRTHGGGAPAKHP